jgi:hypothetical protein
MITKEMKSFTCQYLKDAQAIQFDALFTTKLFIFSESENTGHLHVYNQTIAKFIATSCTQQVDYNGQCILG